MVLIHTGTTISNEMVVWLNTIRAYSRNSYTVKIKTFPEESLGVSQLAPVEQPHGEEAHVGVWKRERSVSFSIFRRTAKDLPPRLADSPATGAEIIVETMVSVF